MVGEGAKTGALRTIRLLRPLRSINKVKGIRVIVTSLILSFEALANVALFLTFIIILLGTFGLHLFWGMFEWRCRLTPEPYQNGTWPLYPDHFRICDQSINNCPAGSFCGAPYDKGIPWDKNLEV